ncbi:hypothetical protein Tco_0843797, partial [Tanacetum coccineum]
MFTTVAPPSPPRRWHHGDHRRHRRHLTIISSLSSPSIAYITNTFTNAASRHHPLRLLAPA